MLISLYLPLLWKYLKHCADQPPLYSLVHPLTHWTRPTHSLPGIHWPAAASPGNSPVTAVPSKLFSARALWLTAAASLPICLWLCFCLCLNCLCPLCHIMFTENRELCKPLSLHNKIATIHTYEEEIISNTDIVNTLTLTIIIIYTDNHFIFSIFFFHPKTFFLARITKAALIWRRVASLSVTTRHLLSLCVMSHLSIFSITAFSKILKAIFISHLFIYSFLAMLSGDKMRSPMTHLHVGCCGL